MTLSLSLRQLHCMAHPPWSRHDVGATCTSRGLVQGQTAAAACRMGKAGAHARRVRRGDRPGPIGSRQTQVQVRRAGPCLAGREPPPLAGRCEKTAGPRPSAGDPFSNATFLQSQSLRPRSVGRHARMLVTGGMGRARPLDWRYSRQRRTAGGCSPGRGRGSSTRGRVETGRTAEGSLELDLPRHGRSRQPAGSAVPSRRAGGLMRTSCWSRGLRVLRRAREKGSRAAGSRRAWSSGRPEQPY